MKKRLSLGCAVTLLLAFLFYLFLLRRATVTPEALLLNSDEPNFPTGWNSKAGPFSVNWRKMPTSWPSTPGTFSESDRGVGWTNDGVSSSASSAEVVEWVYRYRTAAESAFWYWWLVPEHAYAYKWPNFRADEYCGRCYPKEWGYKSISADQEHVVCGMGPPEECQLWFYWARHGQFIVEVFFLAVNKGISPNVFQQIVAPIDAYVSQELSK